MRHPPLMMPPDVEVGGRLRVLAPPQECFAWRRVARREEAVRDHDAVESVGVLGDETQADERAPVLPDERRVLQIDRVEPRGHPVDMALIGVVVELGRLVAAAEADQIGGEHPMSRGCEDRDHLPVQVRPRRLAVHAQDRVRVAGPSSTWCTRNVPPSPSGTSVYLGAKVHPGRFSNRSSGVLSARMRRPYPPRLFAHWSRSGPGRVSKRCQDEGGRERRPRMASCFGSTGVGDPVMGSAPDCVFGNAMTSRMFSSPATIATRRSRPNAKPP